MISVEIYSNFFSSASSLFAQINEAHLKYGAYLYFIVSFYVLRSFRFFAI